MKRMTSHDIARLAGVSRSTVSRVINGYENVPPETREHVMRIIEENRYYPQLSGQLLTGKQMKTLGFFWATGHKDSSGSITTPLTSSYFTHIIEAAASRGYLVLSCILDSLTSKENMDHIRRIFIEGRIDAGIVIGADNNEPLIEELVDLGKIVGLFDYYHEESQSPNRITVNFDRTTGERAIDHLCALGHRKIGIIDGNMNRYSSVQRHESYLRGMRRNHLPIQNKWLCYGGITEACGYEAAHAMLAGCAGDYPTAICANNDSVAFGVYRACRELGLRIPEDLSVIGTDGDPNGLHSSPPLTTFAFDFRNMFDSLVSRVVRSIADEADVPTNDYTPAVLIERGSCAPVSGG